MDGKGGYAELQAPSTPYQVINGESLTDAATDRGGPLRIERKQQREDGDHMNIHEYQAKQILRAYDAPVAEGYVALKAEEAGAAANRLEGPVWVVKAQIHAGGRGKGRFKEAGAGDQGGVRIAKSAEEAAQQAQMMLGRTLVTHQTGPAGKQVHRVSSRMARRSKPNSTSPF